MILKKDFYLYYTLDGLAKILFAIYREYFYPINRSVDKKENLEDIVLSDNQCDPLIQTIFECPENIKTFDIIHEKYIDFPPVEGQVTMDDVWETNAWKNQSISSKRISIEQINSKDELIKRFLNDSRIQDEYKRIIKLKVVRKLEQEKLQEDSLYNRDHNQYMTWKSLEEVKNSGRFDKFIQKETENNS